MFVKGKEYRRSELHDRYGGQRQGGISTPADYDIILLFTSDRGEEFGYIDGWAKDGTFHYTGEGQRGDMQFLRGNTAIRDHIDNGKEIHLFEKTKKGYARYIGKMVYEGHYYRQGPDITGRNRQIIVFKLKPVE